MEEPDAAGPGRGTLCTAAAAQREVTDMTNELLKKNAQKLKMATIETARETERGIVDMETHPHELPMSL